MLRFATRRVVVPVGVIGIGLAGAFAATAATTSTPSLEAFDKPITAADAVEGKTHKFEDRSKARRVVSTPAGWKAWLTTGQDPTTGEPTVCLLVSEPNAPSNVEGPASFCATNGEAAKFGVGGIKIAETSNEATFINYLPAGASITAIRGEVLPNVDKRPGASARGQLKLVKGVDAAVKITAANGETRTIDPSEQVNDPSAQITDPAEVK